MHEHCTTVNGNGSGTPWLVRPVYLRDFLTAGANGFGVVRIAMALAVLVSHSYLLRFGGSSAEPLHSWTGHSLGEHAVQVFFFLSGVLVAQSFDRSRSVIDFAAGRFLRIFPGLYVCVLATVFLLGPAVTRYPAASYFFDPGTLYYLARTMSLSTGAAPLPGVFETLPLASTVNMSLWTLKYEVLCYVGLAVAGVLGLFKPDWRKAATVVLAVFVGLIFVSDVKPIETYTAADNIRYFALFFGTGVLAYLLRDVMPIHGGALFPLFGLFVFAIGTRFGELATALFLGYATLWVATFTFGRLGALTNRYDLSFGAYIYACPVQQTLIALFPEADALALAILAVALVLPVAALSWVIVEKPCLQQRQKLSRSIGSFLGLVMARKSPLQHSINRSAAE